MTHKKRFRVPFAIILTIGLLLAFSVPLAQASDSMQNVNIDVEEFRLKNGMLFLVVNRPATPQIACRLAIRAGSALEEAGKTGIAHLLEHMMFKGTKNFGTTDVAEDERLQKKIEAAYQAILSEKNKRQPDVDIIRKHQEEMEKLREEVQKIYVAQAFSSQLGQNGAVGINAFTSKDQTQYVASVPADMIEQWFSIISEQLFEPSWREFYVEKDVVQREWAFRYVNNPAGAAWLDLNATAYIAHPYRNPTIGWKPDMEKYNTRDAMAFHQKYYNPTNAVCVLVGDITVEQARMFAQTYFERYPAGPRSTEHVTAEPEQTGPRRAIRHLKGARTPLIRIGHHAARMGTTDFYALDAMTMILSSGRSARLTQGLVNQGRAVEAWAHNPDNRYAGMVMLGGSPNEPEGLKGLNEEERRRAYFKACEALENELIAEVEKMKTEPVTEQELARIIKLNERSFLERLRSNENLAGLLATLEVQIGWRYLNSYLKKMAAVTPGDIQKAARKYIHDDNRTTVFVLPGGKPVTPPARYEETRNVSGSTAAAMSRPGDLKNNSIYPTPAGWKHPLSFDRKPKKIVYPKAQTAEIGPTKVFFLPDRELPLIDLMILVKAGSVDITPSKTGLGDILNNSFVKGGTRTHSPVELARLLDDAAIELSIGVGEESTLIHLSVLKDDWKKGLTILQEVLTQPAFDGQVIEVAKQQALVGLQRQGGNAQAVAMREGMIKHFAGHPYGRDPLLGLETIPQITANDLRRFVKTYFVPSNMVVAASGDIDKEEVVAGIRKLFKSLPDTRAPRRVLNEPQGTSPTLSVVPKPGQVQSQVILIMPGIKRTDPNFWKLRLLMDIFGGSDSLMYTRLRDDLGLVYSAGFFQAYKWKAGFLMGYIGCKGDRTSVSIDETINIMNSLASDVPETDIELKRREALNSFVFNVDTPTDLVKTYAMYYMRGEPLDTLEMIQEAYMKVSRSELLKLAQQHLSPERLKIVAVADTSIPVGDKKSGTENLADALKALAEKQGLPYAEIPLR